MSAKHAVLGLVIESPGYGYQLAQRLDRRCGSWGWERTVVYGALDSLERDGHVRSRRTERPVKQGRGAPRLVYEATPSGLEFFRVWMSQPAVPGSVRQELDLKLLFLGPELVPPLINQTWTQERQCLNQLNVLSAAECDPDQVNPSEIQELARRLQLDAEMKLLQARIEWLRHARLVLREYLESHPRHDRGAGRRA